jgi:glycolate oxidase iron-sulfur subunit
MKNILSELAKCSRCGKCKAVCPVFRVLGDELRVARGRVSLIEAYLAGGLAASDKLTDALASCMKCRQCENVCPIGVKLVPGLLAAREKLLRDRREGGLTRAFLDKVVASRGRFDAALRIAAIGQKILPGSEAAPLRHLPVLFSGRRKIPEIAKQSILKKYPEVVRPDRRPTGRVGLFVGCLENYVETRVIDAVIKILVAAGREVVIPKRQLCCGLPAATLGQLGSARKFAAANRKAFGRWKLDAIVSACATCTGMLSKGYAEFLGMEGVFTAPVMDFVEILGSLDIKTRKLKIRTTYHDPCHHTNRGIRDAPREWLRRVSEYVEMRDADRCCGGGGSFSLFYYDTSRKIAEVKEEAVRAAAPDAVVTSCPGCMVQLADVLGGSPPVTHLAEIIAEAVVNP